MGRYAVGEEDAPIRFYLDTLNEQNVIDQFTGAEIVIPVADNATGPVTITAAPETDPDSVPPIRGGNPAFWYKLDELL
jgi:hypothetical protein